MKTFLPMAQVNLLGLAQVRTDWLGLGIVPNLNPFTEADRM